MKRKTPAFTELTLRRFIREGRGQGILEHYVPWHQVRRSDPSSRGKSGRYFFRNRLIHLLSTVEEHAYLLSTMDPYLFDLREQFPLSLGSSNHELDEYSNSYGRFYPGTIEIAKQLGIRRPKLPGGMSWISSTDLLITRKTTDGLSLLAVACKTKSPLPDTPEWKSLLIEKVYWESRGVTWLLITPQDFDPGFGATLRSYRAFCLDQMADRNLVSKLVSTLLVEPHSYHSLINKHMSEGYDQESIKKAFWTGFWYGDIPISIRVRFQPLSILRLIPRQTFLDGNPILSRRSAWTSM